MTSTATDSQRESLNAVSVQATTGAGLLAGMTAGRINWIAVIFWQVIAILVVEFALFCAGLGEEEILKLDPELGTIHMTHKRVTWRNEGRSVSYFNEHGLREGRVLVPKPAGTYRVALLGDSMVESLQVPIESSFGKLLEDRLRKETGKKIEVLNFGVSGYSTVQEYLLLKRQVLKFGPDLVLVCYNNRDAYENWAAPDAVLTNVRPCALHLPGGKLTVDTSPVTMWLKTPRAKLLKQCEWLRQNSRLWGLLAAMELDLSLHNQTYKQLAFFVVRPGKALREWWARTSAALSAPASQWTSSQNDGFTDAGGAGASPPRGAKDDQTGRAGPLVLSEQHRSREEPALPSAQPSGMANSGSSSLPSPRTGTRVERSARVGKGKPRAGSVGSTTGQTPASGTRSAYDRMVMRTLGSLLEEMAQETSRAGGKMGVVVLPVRAALCPSSAGDEAGYANEVDMLTQACREKGIPVLDCQAAALGLPFDNRRSMFFDVHLTARGHDEMSCWLEPFVRRFVHERTSL